MVSWTIYAEVINNVRSVNRWVRVVRVVIPPEWEYVCAIGIICWLFVMVWFVLNITKLTDKINISPRNIWVSIYLVLKGFYKYVFMHITLPSSDKKQYVEILHFSF